MATIQDAVDKAAEELENLRGMEDVVDNLEHLAGQVERLTVIVIAMHDRLPELIQALAPLAHLRAISDNLDRRAISDNLVQLARTMR